MHNTPDQHNSMHKTFIQVYRGSMHIQLEIKLAPSILETLDAYVRFLNAPPVTSRHDKPKQTETTRQHITRLIRNMLRENGLTLEGDLIIANMRMTPAQDLHCALEITHHRPSNTSSRPGTSHPKSRSPSPKPSSICDISCQIMRHAAPPEARADLGPGTAAWEEAAHNFLLHALVRAIATKHDIVISEESAKAHLENFSNALKPQPGQGNLSLLQGAAEHLLVETVVARHGSS